MLLLFILCKSVYVQYFYESCSFCVAFVFLLLYDNHTGYAALGFSQLKFRDSVVFTSHSLLVLYVSLLYDNYLCYYYLRNVWYVTRVILFGGP